jgi:hypothetical protein
MSRKERSTAFTAFQVEQLAFRIYFRQSGIRLADEREEEQIYRLFCIFNRFCVISNDDEK